MQISLVQGRALEQVESLKLKRPSARHSHPPLPTQRRSQRIKPSAVGPSRAGSQMSLYSSW